MAIIGHGIDLVDTARIAQMLEAHEPRFLQRCFTSGEIAYCDANPKRKAEHLAARFAAKEAIYKALGTGRAEGITWTEAEVMRDTNGRPSVKLTGKAAKVARELGITRWHLSLTHIESHAMASVIAEG